MMKTAPENENLSQRWQIEGPFDSSYSLAIVNRELARALDQLGLDVALRSREGHGDFAASERFLEENPDCARMVAKRFDHGSTKIPDVALRFCFPPHLDDMPAKIKLIHSYGWEETGFPQKYVDEFNQELDLVSVLSQSVGKHLRDSGVRVPIVVTGAGVDHLLRTDATPLPIALENELRAFRFLHISSCFPRKGVDVLLRAFEAGFNQDDAVTLIIKTFPNPHNTVKRELEEMRKENPHFPHVIVIDEDWSQEKILGLYRAAHTLVAPSRGEGFGLPMAEAMLFEVPVITTNWGGQTDFCDASNAWCCDYTFAKADTHMGLTHSLWAEPDQTHLTRLMREMTKLTDAEKLQKVQRAKERILANYTWGQTAKKLRQAIASIEHKHPRSEPPAIAWISTWNARCGIANYSHFLTENLPQARLAIFANHIPERMGFDAANVVRCWNVKPEEDFNYPLELILEQGIRAVVVQYNFGFCSTANLAKFIRSLSENGIALYLFFHSTADVVVSGELTSLGHIAETLRQATRIFVHSLEDVNRLKAWDLVENVIYFPHGIGARPLAQKVKSVRFQGKRVIASYGFLLPHKGIRQLIQAFSELVKGDKNLHLMLLNALYPASVSSDEEKACRDLILELELEAHVSLMTDFLSESGTQEILADADLIVFPYQQTQESSSAAVRVGLATGKPVAVTPLAIFADVDNAVHRLPGTSSQEIFEGLSFLLSASDTILQKHEAVDQWFVERDWALLSSRLLNIIDGLADSRVDTLNAC